MINILRLNATGFSCNSYLITCKDYAYVVDPGIDAKIIKNELAKRNLPLKAVLLTHCHYDHSACVKELQDAGAKVYMHRDEEQLLKRGGHCAMMFMQPFDEFTPDVLLNDGDVIEFDDKQIKVVHTPGHTIGGVCYILDDVIFSGDTVFCMSIGRSDLPSGNGAQLLKSVKKILEYSGKKIYSGHDEETSVEFEREHNPYA